MTTHVGQLKVMAVDDNPDILLNLDDFLRSSGYDVETATSAPEALGKIRKGSVPSILVSDIVMPGSIDGIELARIVSRSYPKVGILLMTGWSYDDTHGFPVLAKPFELDEINTWISSFLAK